MRKRFVPSEAIVHVDGHHPTVRVSDNSHRRNLFHFFRRHVSIRQELVSSEMHNVSSFVRSSAPFDGFKCPRKNVVNEDKIHSAHSVESSNNRCSKNKGQAKQERDRYDRHWSADRAKDLVCGSKANSDWCDEDYSKEGIAMCPNGEICRFQQFVTMKENS